MVNFGHLFIRVSFVQQHIALDSCCLVPHHDCKITSHTYLVTVSDLNDGGGQRGAVMDVLRDGHLVVVVVELWGIVILVLDGDVHLDDTEGRPVSAHC